jgi:crotonobetainyl-CoA:carnitine CoA-transferase CaiB-like acyl-CoA transferase
MATQVKKPLEGVRVLDFGWRAVAPLAARLLAWGGAEVIRIESAIRHDGARQTPPMTPGVKGSFNVSAWWNVMNSNKLSISLNLAHPKGKELALKLVPLSDIVVENFSAGTMDKLGLGYDVMRQRKPDIIFVSHSLSGVTGPWKHVKGHGPMAAAMAGLHYLSGPEETPPVSPGSAYTDYVTNPHHSAYAILAALHYRRKTGKGQFIDLAQYESIAASTGTAILEYTANGEVRPRIGSRSPNFAPQGVYPCRPFLYKGQEHDRWIAISITSDQEWKALCDVIERKDLGSDARYGTFAGRKQHEDDLDKAISGWTKDQDAHVAMITLQRAGVPAGAVQNAMDLMERDPQMAVRGHYQSLEHAEAGVTRYDGPPFKLSATPISLTPAPLLGEHNDYVFRQVLKLSDEEINDGLVAGYIA